MPSPSGWSAVSNTNASYNNLIDSLLYGTKWASGALTYSYPELSSYWSTDLNSGYGSKTTGSGEPWSTAYDSTSYSDRSYIPAMLQRWANVANITFTQVAENSTIVGDIRFAYSYGVNKDFAQAWVADFPNSTAKAGDIWFNSYGTSATSIFTPGSYEGFAVLHELGHALGLKHPFQTYGHFSSVLPNVWDSQSFTIMSYSASVGDSSTTYSFMPTTPMLLDIQAIQYLYGKNNNYNAGDSQYSYSDASYYHETIWDGGGTDSINYNGYYNSTIDLRQGYGSAIGNSVYIKSENTGLFITNVKNVWVAYGTVIENAIGGSGNDSITGNDSNNILSGGYGNDTITGGLGDDKLDWDSTARGGNDTMYGGAGDDIYCLSGFDSITEYSGEGVDSVWVDTNYSLPTYLENLYTYTNSTGNYTLTGNSFDNIISGAYGNDTLVGGGGNDTFKFDSNSNGLDTITDTAVGDKLIIKGAYFTGAVTQGYGSNVGLNQIQCYTSGTSTTLCIGTDSTLGADVTIKLNGLFAFNQFQAQGTNINIISYVNHAPIANADSAIGYDGITVTILSSTLLANDTDANVNDTKTIVSASATSLKGVPISFSSYGLGYSVSSQFQALKDGATATDSFTYTIKDSGGLTSTATVNMTIYGKNDAPTAIDLIVSSVTGSQSFTGILGFATDPDVGDTLSLYSVPATSTAGAALSINGTDIIYTPASSFNQLKAGVTANDSFAYTIKDSAGATSTAIMSVALIGVNDTPIAVNDSAGIIEAGLVTLLGSTLLSNDTDIDGDVLTIKSVPSKSNKGASLNFANGNITYSAGTLFESLKAGATTTDSFNYTIKDELGLTSQALVTITMTGVNDAPTVSNSIAAPLALSNIAYSFTVPNSTFVDKDTGDTLTYTVTLSDSSPLPSWLSFNSTTRTFSGTPAIADAGNYSLSIKATDTSGLSASSTFNMTVDTKTPVTLTGANDKYTGTSSDERIDGRGGNDTLSAGDGDDVLIGGTGIDKLIGGLGDDTYIIADANSKGKANDVITEKAYEGTDTVISSIASYTLVKEVEILQLKEASEAITGIGFKSNETITGNSAANTINGKEGNDTLTGGTGKDTFVFDTKLSATANVDMISDFTSASDVINLSKKIFTANKTLGALTDADFGTFNSKAFVAETTATATTVLTKHFLFDMGTGNLYYDADGNKANGKEAILFAKLTGVVDLTASDLHII